MKKSIIFCISILALVFASCKSTPTAEETTDETAQETTAQPVVEDQAALVETNDSSAETSESSAADQIAALNQAKLGQLNQKFNYISALMDLEYTLNVELSSHK